MIWLVLYVRYTSSGKKILTLKKETNLYWDKLQEEGQGRRSSEKQQGWIGESVNIHVYIHTQYIHTINNQEKEGERAVSESNSQFNHTPIP